MSNIFLRSAPASPGRYEFRTVNGSIKIVIGNNHVAESELTELQKNKFFLSLVEQDLIAVETPEIENKKTKKTKIKEELSNLPDSDPSEDDLKETV
jgi:hypothetical protein